jgi:TPR repeat protein
MARWTVLVLVALVLASQAQSAPRKRSDVGQCFADFGAGKFKAALGPCRRAAEAGDDGAQTRYAQALWELDTKNRKGKLVGFWFCKAAAQRDGFAPLRLGAMHFLGYGFPKSDFKALVWWTVASGDGGDSLGDRIVRNAIKDSKVKERLSARQIAAAKAKAAAIRKQIEAGVLKRCD